VGLHGVRKYWKKADNLEKGRKMLEKNKNYWENYEMTGASVIKL
jgi:hypothetical protein